MKGLSKIDDTIEVKKACYFNYYRRLKKAKVISKDGHFVLHLNRTRRASLMPSVLGQKTPVCLFGIYTNSCLFDLEKLSKDDKLKLFSFYPELADQVSCLEKLKKVRK